MKLNLGCCDRHLPGYVNVDICPPCDQIADLSRPWPWADSSVSEIIAHDIVEHLPDRIHTMNEAWRVLAPGGRIEIVVPSAVKGSGFAQDPTHVSQWCRNTFQYFDVEAYAFARLSKHYGIKGGFKVIQLYEADYDDYREPVTKITAILEAVK